MYPNIDLSSLSGFDWDEANRAKNWIKHKVDYKEAEEIFFNKPLIIFDDKKHSVREKRWGALGKTNKGRVLAIYFTIRNNRIRIISARDQGRKDKTIYANIEQKQNFQKKEKII